MVDDDRALCELTRDYLRRFDFQVEIETRPGAALRRLESESFALAIVDVMMPEFDGFEFVRRLRGGGARLPVIMLTARGEIADRVVGLETGADDYLPKPFEPRELAARLTALSRRATATAEGDARALEFVGLRVDAGAQRVEIEADGEWREVFLTAGEFRMLAALLAARPAVVGRNELAARLRGIEFDCADRSLDITVSRVRAKLGDSAERPRFIKTARGVGYAFVGREKPPASA